MGLIVTLALGGFIAVGALISYLTRENKTIVQMSIAVALGTLSMLAVLELIPEAVEHLGEHSAVSILIGIVCGVVFLMVLDRFLPDHDASMGGHSHHHTGAHKAAHEHAREHHDAVSDKEQQGHSEHAHKHSHEHVELSYKHGHDHAQHNAMHIGIISAIAVTLHNIIEGMAVYSIAEQSVMTGLMVALGVGLHNIPMGMVIYATLKDKRKERTAMILLASLSTFFGGVLMALLWNVIGDGMVGVLISVTLGMIIYIVAFELIPMVLHEKKWKVTVPGIAIGVGIILISTLLD